MAAAPQVVTYGLESDKGDEWLKQVLKSGAPQLMLELQGFGRGGTEELGGISKEAHAKNILGGWYPWVWKHWNDWADLILWAWCNYEEIGVTGCTGAGKSYIFSLLSWIEWSAAPVKSACVLSSTTKSALKSRIWYHIKRFRAGLIVNGQQAVYPCHLIDSQTIIQAEKGDDMHQMTSVAVEGGKLEQAWGNIIGRHPERQIVFVDEGEQTPEAIFSSRFNLRAGTTFYRFCTSANAVNPASPYGLFIRPKGGWGKVSHNDEFWDTDTGICLHFSAFKSPNVIAGARIVPGLILQQDIDAVRQSKGEDSLEWWSMILGFPAMNGVRNTVLSWAHIASGKATEKAIWQGETRTIGALDPAHTSDGDNCVLRFARVGLRDDGTMTLGLEPPIYIKLTISTDVPEDYQVAERVREECQKRNVNPQDFAMDATSASGTASIIEQRWAQGIRKINFGAGPTERRMPGDDKTGKERCRFRIEELWFGFASIVRSGQVRGLDAKSAEQFCTRKYRLEGERYVIQPKSQGGRGFDKGMKQETGKDSPDEADCTVLLGDIFRDIAGIEQPASNGMSRSEEWEKAARRFNLRETYA